MPIESYEEAQRRLRRSDEEVRREWKERLEAARRINAGPNPPRRGSFPADPGRGSFHRSEGGGLTRGARDRMHRALDAALDARDTGLQPRGGKPLNTQEADNHMSKAAAAVARQDFKTAAEYYQAAWRNYREILNCDEELTVSEAASLSAKIKKAHDLAIKFGRQWARAKDATFEWTCKKRGCKLQGHVIGGRTREEVERRADAHIYNHHGGPHNEVIRGIKAGAKDNLPGTVKYDPSGWCPKKDLDPAKVEALKARKRRLMELPTDEVAHQYRRLSRINVGRQPKSDMVAEIIRADTSKRDLYFGGWQV